MKVYIAARYSRKEEMREHASKFIKAGIDVTSRWLSETNPSNTALGDDSTEFYEETAKIDLQDIWSADALVFFSEDPLVGTPRGGRHVEFGYAIGQNIPVYVIGKPENVFHYLPGIKFFDTVEDFLEAVR